MRAGASNRTRVLLFAAVSVACSKTHAHASFSEEAVWFFFAALLAIPFFLFGVILLMVHLVVRAKQRSRLRRTANGAHASDAMMIDTGSRGSAGTVAAWLIGGPVILLASVACAGLLSRLNLVSFWPSLAVLVALMGLIIWSVRYASRRSRETRARAAVRTPSPSRQNVPPALEEPINVSESSREAEWDSPPPKASSAILWISIALLGVGALAVLSPYYLMHRRDIQKQQSEAARAAALDREAEQDAARQMEARRNQARIDQMAREMMGESPPPAPPPLQTAEQKAQAKRIADEQRMQCYFYGVFDVLKRGVPHQITMRTDGTFESVNKADMSVRTGKWSYSTEPNWSGNSHQLVFTYSKGLPAVDEETLTQLGQERVSTQNMAGRYDYQRTERFEHPDCVYPVPAR